MPKSVMHSYTQLYTHVPIHSLTHTYIHTCILTYRICTSDAERERGIESKQERKPKERQEGLYLRYIHTYMHTYIHTYIHAHIHTTYICIIHIHMYIHTYITRFVSGGQRRNTRTGMLV